MTDLLKEIFYFQIIKPNNIFSVSIMSDSVIKLKESVCGKKQEVEKKISSVKQNTFFQTLKDSDFIPGRPTLIAVPATTLPGILWLIMKEKRRGALGFLVLNRIPGLSF